MSFRPPNEEMNYTIFYRKYFNLIRVNYNDQVLFTELTKTKNNIWTTMDSGSYLENRINIK